MKHKAVTSKLQEQASLYVLGFLEPGKAATLEAHLSECAVCGEEVRMLRETAGELAFGAPAATPSPALGEELMRRVAGKEPQSASVLVRAHEGDWQSTPFPGVHARHLFTDPSGNVTQLVRLEAGAKYPAHRHAGHEHCYVLEGDLVFHDHALYAGDYEVNRPDTDHSEVTSKNGCLLLIVNHLSDQVLSA